ncbi:MAG: hypothetical protein ACRDH0_01570 [Actinomycetota bacterium]
MAEPVERNRGERVRDGFLGLTGVQAASILPSSTTRNDERIKPKIVRPSRPASLGPGGVVGRPVPGGSAEALASASVTEGGDVFPGSDFKTIQIIQA